MLIKDQINLVNSLIHIYFKNKFLDGTVSFLLPKMAKISEQILIQNDQLIQLYLNNQYLLNSNQFNLLYSASEDNYSFEKLSSTLTNYPSQTFILLQFSDETGVKYTVGGFNSQKWSQQLGNESAESYIFSLSPKYRHYYPVLKNQNSSQYSKPVCSLLCQLNINQTNGKDIGIAFGMNKEDCRIWIDSKSLKQSFVKNSEKFFKKGNLLPPNIKNPQCTFIEVYGVHTDQNKRNFTHSSFNNMQLNQILLGSRDHINSLTMSIDSSIQSHLLKSNNQINIITEEDEILKKSTVSKFSEDNNEALNTQQPYKSAQYPSTYTPSIFNLNTDQPYKSAQYPYTFTPFTSNLNIYQPYKSAQYPSTYTRSTYSYTPISYSETTYNPKVNTYKDGLPEYQTYFTPEKIKNISCLPEGPDISSLQPTRSTISYQTQVTTFDKFKQTY